MIRKLLTTTAIVAVISTGALAQSMNNDAQNNMGGSNSVFSTERPATEMQSQNGYFATSPDQMLATDLIGSTVYAVASAKTTTNADPAARTEMKSDAKTGMNAQTGSEDKSAMNGQASADAKSNMDAKATTETDSGMKPETKADMKSDSNAEAKPEMKAEAKPEMKADQKTETTTTANAEPEALGDINDLLLASDGSVKAVIIGVGGFLGIGEKEVAVDITRISFVEQDGERWLMLDATKEELENAPEFTKEEDRTADASDKSGGSMTKDQTKVQTSADSSSSTYSTSTTTSANNMDKTAAANERMQNDESAKTEDKTASAMDKSDAGANQTVDVTKLSSKELIGTQVYGSEDKVIGEVSDVILDGKKQVEAFIVDVGGFLGIGEKPVALDAKALQVSKDKDGDLTVHTPYTEARLEQQKAYSEEAYKTDKDSVTLR